jgi:uncharacterized membrane protein
MSDFFQEFFLNPLLVNGWFNPVNTLLWGVILVVASFLVYSRLLKKMKVKVDRHFALAILPFIFWASSTRALRDLAYSFAERSAAASSLSDRFMTDLAFQTGLIQQQAFSYVSFYIPIPQIAGFFSWVIALFPTPGSYVFTFLFALGILLISLGIQRITAKSHNSAVPERRRPGRLPATKETEGVSRRLPAIVYRKPMLLIGLVASALNAWMIPWSNFWGMGMILGITGAFTAGFFGLAYLGKRLEPRLKGSRYLGGLLGIFSPENSTLLSVHMLDSSATFVSVMFFGYYEQHPVPRLFIESIGPWTFFALKLAVLIPSLYIIDRYAEDGEFKNFLKIIILILGLAPGLRDMIRLGAGV